MCRWRPEISLRESIVSFQVVGPRNQTQTTRLSLGFHPRLSPRLGPRLSPRLGLRLSLKLSPRLGLRIAPRLGPRRILPTEPSSVA